jgi:hypothetical protein
MEIFRTDGGGKSIYNKRLSKLLVNFCKTAPRLVKKVSEIRDHKGTLMVQIKDKEDADVFYHLFSYLWQIRGEHAVSIFYDGVCVIGYNLGENL